MKRFKAIAAMSLNRAIGLGSRIPWRLPEDFQWFKGITTGNILVMGRKTFESIGKPLPGRTTIVLSRGSFAYPGVRVARNLAEIDPTQEVGDVFLCGGAQVYQQALPFCSDLYLTVVKRNVEGDVFFPPFENLFELGGTILDRPDFVIQHWVRDHRYPNP